jgi:hypothetical protein
MSDDRVGNVIKFDSNKFKGQRVDEVEVNDLLQTLVAAIQDNLEPRLNAEVKRAIAPLQLEIEKLRNSLVLVAQQVERVRLGTSADAGLVVTDDPNASVTLASAKISQEERYPFSTVDLATRVPASPATSRVATVVEELGLKGDPKYWCEMRVGATAFNRYSVAALARVQEAFKDPSKHLPQNSPAFRTVMNFLEGV